MVPGSRRTAGTCDAAECDATSRPRVKREKPTTATRTVTRLPPFLPPGLPGHPRDPVRSVTFPLPAGQGGHPSQSRVRQYTARLSAIVPARLATAADATRLTPAATGSRRRRRVPVHASRPAPNRANTTPAKIAGPLSIARAPLPRRRLCPAPGGWHAREAGGRHRGERKTPRHSNAHSNRTGPYPLPIFFPAVFGKRPAPPPLGNPAGPVPPAYDDARGAIGR
ncbi:hypothetical protein SHJG_5467 [Streptomyces hygroscopicus subsp. jinggangensis 5008]|nr:hypothetical protein SHJG_5467 [Streptomyces hygroscopicus subsp. jinggangensis 5008]AGF64893.1 hypothetical protein SHJGH_5230 [Streptomyces hygroscopicus subsp. jinggangensis TL01]